MEVVAHSDKMARLLRLMRATAQSDKPALMLGASGSGRRFLGQRLHDMSPRKDNPLVGGAIAMMSATGQIMSERSPCWRD